MSFETFGWDTVSALPLAEANQILAANPGGLPATFGYGDDSASVKGTYQNWQFVPGVEGTAIPLQLNLASGTLAIAGSAAIDITGIGVQVLVNLGLLPVSTSPSVVLGFDPSKPASPGKVIDPGNKLTADQAEVLSLLMAAAFNADPSAATVSFATLNTVPPGSSSKFAPVEARFQYLSTPANPNGSLVIFGSTVQRDISQLPLEADAALLASGGPAYLISGRDILQRIFEPLLPGMLGGETADDIFNYSDDPPALKNNRPFTIAAVDNAYNPLVQQFTLQINGAIIELSMSGICTIEGSLALDFTASSSSALIYAGTFMLLPAGKPRVTVKVVGGASPTANSGIVIGQITEDLEQALTADLIEAVNPVILDLSLLQSIDQMVIWSAAPGQPESRKIAAGEMNGGILMLAAA